MNSQNYNRILPINNIQFLNSSVSDLNTDIDERKIVLLIFELMNYINKAFIIDYIIQVDIFLGNDNIICINNIQLFNNNEFNETNVSLNIDITEINETYLKYPHFQILKYKKSDSINNKMLLKENERDSLSVLSNNKYNYKEGMSFSSFNLDKYKKIVLNPLGLKNPSIYCYMNCCLQILLSIPELNYFFFI